ncbi:hypothetical protein BDB01DRAFT_791176 [Pilobolus umbonatus]|nr:hypothetical protein BDB01DRAFT_791176 [Pilobolus umbonatus]
MQSVGPAGFYNVPATKLLLLFYGSCSLLSAIFNLKQYFFLQLDPHITVHHQFWRLLTSQLAFANSVDVFYGSILIYAMRMIERQYGTTKYIAFISLSAVISTILEVLVLMVGVRFGLKYIPGGPYAVIFSSIYQFYSIIPITYRFRIFGVVVTDKLFLYILAFQLAISQSMETIIPTLCGLFTGLLYRTDIGNIKQWRFPLFMQNMAIKFIKPSLVSPPIARSTATVPVQRPILTGLPNVSNIMSNRLRNRRSNTTETGETSSLSDTPTMEGTSSVREYLDTITGRDVAGSELEPPSPTHIRVLMTMFPEHPREAITRALASAHNDLQRAVEIMLNTPSINATGSSRRG